MKESERVRVSGPLAKYAAGFAAKLIAEGYTDLSLRNQLGVVAHFSRWLEAKRIAVPKLTRQAFLASCDRRTAGGRRDHLVVLLMLRLGPFEPAKWPL